MWTLVGVPASQKQRGGSSKLPLEACWRERDVEERQGVEVGKQLREGASFLYFQKFLIITKRPSH